MKHLLISTTIMVCTFLYAGCSTPAPDKNILGEPAETPENAAEAISGADAEVASEDLFEISGEGAQFDPPIAIEDVPDGAWYCDKGTVHYARNEQGDGTCEVCGMALVEKGAEEEIEALADIGG